MESNAPTLLEGRLVAADITLPDDSFFEIFKRLHDRDLARCEAACKAFSLLAGPLWEERCLEAAPTAFTGPFWRTRWQGEDSKDGRRASIYPAHLRHASLAKQFLLNLQQPDDELSLCAEVWQASSTDTAPIEQPSNVLEPLQSLSNSNSRRSYWSSRGSDDEASMEWIEFGLVHPLCVIRSLDIRPYMATFQSGSPVYAPRGVRLVVCNYVRPLGPHFYMSSDDGRSSMDGVLSAPGLAAEQSGWSADGLTWTSPTYPLVNEPNNQHVDFPPIFAARSHVRLELIGRYQLQSADSKFYTCIQYVRINGHHLPHFVSPEPGVIRWVAEDPLELRGGTAAVSERARTLTATFWNVLLPTFPLLMGAEAGIDDAESDED